MPPPRLRDAGGFAHQAPVPRMPTDHFIDTPDGLRLHVSSYGTRASAAPDVLCLPGLARTGTDFHDLASALAGEVGGHRHVLAMDYRGRGRSDYDPDPRNYNLAVELSDVMTVLAALAVRRAVVIGTSRGGILAMLLAATQPTVLAGVVLNDIGPVTEGRGLARIKAYVGKLPQPNSFENGAEILRELFGSQFPRLGSDDWMKFARRTFKEQNGRLEAAYDVRLAQNLQGIDTTQPLPTLWREFDTLAGLPLMLIRGANSDLLSAATVSAMQERRPDMDFVEIPDQGHAPLLVEAGVMQRIAVFIESCDRPEPSGQPRNA